MKTLKDEDWCEIAVHIMNRKKVRFCSAPEQIKDECDKKIIDAHTLSKSLSLKPISYKGEVIAVNNNPFTLEQNQGSLSFIPVGISKASIFNGFCAKHDKLIFSPIENEEFIPTKTSLFLQVYRVVCMERFQKMINVKQREKTLEIQKRQLESLKGSIPDNEFENKMSFLEFFITSAIKSVDLGCRGMISLKEKLDTLYLNEDHSRIRHKVFILKDIKIVSGSHIVVEMDFNNNMLQNFHTEDELEGITFNCIATSENNGFLFFSWFDGNVNAEKLMRSLENKKQKNDLLLEFLYSYSENIFSSPLWWNGLNEEQRQTLRTKANEVNAYQRDFTKPSHKYDAFTIETEFYL